MKFFTYPLELEHLVEFCHPMGFHQLSGPAFHEGQALAGNGFIMIRGDRGRWLESDFEEPPAGFLTRFMAAPWTAPDKASDEWRSVEEIKGSLYRFGVKGMWLKGKCAPSPVWRVGSAFLARQSHLQMIGRLPGCEIFPPRGREHDPDPLHFRFKGGVGILAHDPNLKESSFSVFAPRYCPVDGHEVKRSKPLNWNFGTPPPPEPPIDDWPPREADDDNGVNRFID